MNNEDNRLVVKNMDGADITINVLNILENKNDNSEYICYAIDGMEDVFVSRLIESENSFSLEAISDEEKAAIENIMSKDLDGE